MASTYKSMAQNMHYQIGNKTEFLCNNEMQLLHQVELYTAININKCWEMFLMYIATLPWSVFLSANEKLT
jgi:hypothetical protein